MRMQKKLAHWGRVGWLVPEAMFFFIDLTLPVVASPCSMASANVASRAASSSTDEVISSNVAFLSSVSADSALTDALSSCWNSWSWSASTLAASASTASTPTRMAYATKTREPQTALISHNHGIFFTLRMSQKMT